MAAKPLSFSVKPMLHVGVGDQQVNFLSGCGVIEVTFPNPWFVEIGEIHFKNYYTAWLSVKYRKKEQNSNNEGQWKTCVPRFSMMPHPHTDEACEDYFTISKKQICCDIQNITTLRFILHQPSPVWADFKIEDISMYKTSIHMPPELTLPQWMNDSQAGLKTQHKELKGVPPINTLSHSLQQMWATTEQMKNGQTTATLGRYDVDGSYEVTLLSYT